MSNTEIISTNDDQTIMIEQSNRSGVPPDHIITVPEVREMVDNNSKQNLCQDMQQQQIISTNDDQTLIIEEPNRSDSAPERIVITVPNVSEMVNDNSKKQHPCQDKQQQQSDDRHLAVEVPADQIINSTFSCIESNETSNDIFIPPMSRDSYNKQGSRRTPNLTPPSFHTNLSTGVRLYYSQSQEQCSQSQATAEILTQNQELTQLADDLDDSNGFLSPLPPYSPGATRRTPWGQLLPCSSSQPRIDLLPRDPTVNSSSSIINNANNNCGGISILGLDNVKPSDVFSEYIIGRSTKCDLCINKPSNEMNQQFGQQKLDWAHNSVSNRHCKIFCMLQPKSSNSSTGGLLDVYVEDDSGNGTLINKTILLRRGEKRLLHTGDEICLVNAQSLQKKVNTTNNIDIILQHFSFIFVNNTKLSVTHQQPIKQQLPTQFHSIYSNNLSRSQSSSGKRKAAVDARSTKHPRWNQYSANKPTLDTTNHLDSFQLPAPRSPSSSFATKKARLSPCAAPTASTTTRQQQQCKTNIRRVQEDYDIRDKLGSGTVGDVHRAIHRRTGKECAIKIIQLSRNRGNFNAGMMGQKNDFTIATKQFQEEALILEGLEHPYIVKLFDVYITPGIAVYLVMELLHGGDLFDRIVAKGQYSEIESRRVMRRLLSAIYYLHEERNIVHRDLKPENILCVSQTNDIEVKITDFGLAKAVSGNEDGLKTFCGTPQYFAPEVLKRRHTVSGNGRYGKQADMWSLGVVLYILLSGTPPFDAGLNCVADREAAIDFPEEFWTGISNDAKDLVLKLLVVDPKKRMTVQDACQHKWILTSDGDTHTYPLDDPQLLLSKKRLFGGSSTMGVSTTTSSNNTVTSSKLNIGLDEKSISSNVAAEARTETVPLCNDNESNVVDTSNQSMARNEIKSNIVDTSSQEIVTNKISAVSTTYAIQNLGASTGNCQNSKPHVSVFVDVVGSTDIDADVHVSSNAFSDDDKTLHSEDQENIVAELDENKPTELLATNDTRRPLLPVLAHENSPEKDMPINCIQCHETEMLRNEKPEILASSTPNSFTNEIYSTPSHGSATKHLFEKEFCLYDANLSAYKSATKTVMGESFCFNETGSSSNAAKEVTPGISNLRNPLLKGSEGICRQPIVGGLELSQDEIISQFSDKTESISSFSTIPVVDVSDGELDTRHQDYRRNATGKERSLMQNVQADVVNRKSKKRQLLQSSGKKNTCKTSNKSRATTKYEKPKKNVKKINAGNSKVVLRDTEVTKKHPIPENDKAKQIRKPVRKQTTLSSKVVLHDTEVIKKHPILEKDQSKPARKPGNKQTTLSGWVKKS